MNNFQPVKFNPHLEERMELIVLLGRRRNQILLSPILDLEALEQLVADYEAADMQCAAAALRRRLAWFQGRVEKKRKNGEGRKAALVSRLAAGELMPTI